jgi:hypothetical protein
MEVSKETRSMLTIILLLALLLGLPLAAATAY